MDFIRSVITANIKRIVQVPAEMKVVTEATETTPATYETITPAVMVNVLDIPFNIYHLTCVVDGINYYSQVPQGEGFDGKEALCYVHTKEDISGIDGYIGDPRKDPFKDSAKYKKHWKQTMKDALSTIDADGNVVEYKGKDADELTDIYGGMTK